MINFITETDFLLESPTLYKKWIRGIIFSECFQEGELSFLFCDDQYLHKLNLEFLNHDTLTDILTFDYSLGKELSGDICISIDRVQENAKSLGLSFSTEIARVLAHGVLHLCGHEDTSYHEKLKMRSLEDHYLSRLFS
tara:strand:- start:8483 stop:8896 length:414 start_codon:yes stop_codon:yes gene_type:complete